MISSLDATLLKWIADRGGFVPTDDPRAVENARTLQLLAERGLVVVKRIKEIGRALKPEWRLTVTGRAQVDAPETRPPPPPPEPTLSELSHAPPVEVTPEQFWEYWDEWEARHPKT